MNDYSLEERLLRVERTLARMQKEVTLLRRAMRDSEGARARPERSEQPLEERARTAAQETEERPVYRHLETAQLRREEPDEQTGASQAWEPTGGGLTIPEPMRQSEFWLRVVGIGLLLFAVAFLFRYAIEQGWLGPPVRVALGLLTGAVLVGVGVRIGDDRPEFSAVLLGGGIGVFYITGFAAFQLYDLVPHSAAFLFMVLNTVLAFVLSLRREEAALSLIGVLGGLGTPFLLNDGSGGPAGLVAYLSLLVVGVGAIYLFRGWQVLLWSAAGGSLAIYFVTVLSIALRRFSAIRPWRADVAIQAGLLVTLLVFWALPVVRAVLAGRDSSRWPGTHLGIADGYVSDKLQDSLRYDVLLLTLVGPFAVLFLSFVLWEPVVQTAGGGWITLATAGVFLALAAWLRWEPVQDSVAAVHGLVGVSMLTLALPLLFDDWALLLAYAWEMAALHLLARRWTHPLFSKAAHVVSGLLLLLALQGSIEAQPEGANVATQLSLLAVIGALAALSAWLRGSWARDGYLLAAFLLLALWFPMALELEGALLLVAFTAQAAALHLLGWRLERARVVGSGHLAIILICAWVVSRLEGATPGLAVLADLLFIGTVAAISTWLRRSWARDGYLLAAFFLLALWFPMALELEGAVLLVAYTVEAATLHLLGWRLERARVVGSGHLAIIITGAGVVSRLVGATLGLAALADLLFVGIVAAISVVLAPAARRTYLYLAHAGLLLWFWGVLGALENGQALVSVAWGVYAVILLLGGLRLDRSRVRLTAMVTLALLVGKLFLVDLANVATILRILLFFGFGVLFLVLAYFYSSLWRPKIEGDAGG